MNKNISKLIYCIFFLFSNMQNCKTKKNIIAIIMTFLIFSVEAKIPKITSKVVENALKPLNYADEVWRAAQMFGKNIQEYILYFIIGMGILISLVFLQIIFSKKNSNESSSNPSSWEKK